MPQITEDRLAQLTQAWPVPSTPRPIVIIGAGAIVEHAHLPAYRALGLDVAAVYDIDPERAGALTRTWDIPNACPTLADAVSNQGAVFDLAIPPEHVHETLTQLPDGSPVLIQKPLGADLAGATRIVEICRAKDLTAAVNFQLRFSPVILALRDAAARGILGTITDCEVRVSCETPWHTWPFLEKLPRMEILQHSVHYLDTIRLLLGEPRAVHARTVPHPDFPRLASTRSNIILDFADNIRCAVSTNHHHRWGPRFAASELRLEGTKGAAIAKLGVNLNYPAGEPDELHITTDEAGWQQVPLRGNWFPHAFEGPMSNLQRYIAGEDDSLISPVTDSLRTMALVEACYISNDAPGTPILDPTQGPTP